MKHPLALLQAVDIPAIYSDELGLWGDSPQDVLGPIHKASNIMEVLGFLLNT